MVFSRRPSTPVDPPAASPQRPSSHASPVHRSESRRVTLVPFQFSPLHKPRCAKPPAPTAPRVSWQFCSAPAPCSRRVPLLLPQEFGQLARRRFPCCCGTVMAGPTGVRVEDVRCKPILPIFGSIRDFDERNFGSLKHCSPWHTKPNLAAAAS